MLKFEDYYTAQAAAEEIGIRKKTLLRRISRGHVEALTLGQMKLIHRDEVSRLKAEASSK